MRIRGLSERLGSVWRVWRERKWKKGALGEWKREVILGKLGFSGLVWWKVGMEVGEWRTGRGNWKEWKVWVN